MIKSTFKIFNIITFLLMVFYLLLVLWTLYMLDTKYYHFESPIVYNKHIPFKGMTNSTVIWINLLFIPLAVLLCSFLITEPMIISIDLQNQTISYTNAFTRHTRSFSLKDVDGYIETNQTSRYGSYKVFYLIKDKKVVQKIKGYYYKNMDELRQGINGLSNLGLQTITPLKRLKILFNQSLLD